MAARSVAETKKKNLKNYIKFIQVHLGKMYYLKSIFTI